MAEKRTLFLLKIDSPTKAPLVKNLGLSRKFVWCGSEDTAKLSVRELSDWAERIFVSDAFLDTLKKVGLKSKLFPFAEAGFKEIESIPKNNLRVSFFPSNDTHVKTFYPITRFFNRHMIFISSRKGEGAEAAADKLGLTWERYQIASLPTYRPDVVVLANDWGLDEKLVIAESRSLGIPTVCIQEGPLDFGPTEPHRMEWADFPFIQGPIMTRFLDRENYFVTGNPRFDSIRRSGLKEKPLVMVNLNFTYGVEEEFSEEWLRGVAEACQELGLDFFVSQHPRDRHSFPNLPVEVSNPGVVHEHLSRATILVTRFSTLAYEALLMDREVVYHNPHGEKMRIFNEDESGAFWRTKNKKELKEALSRISRGVRRTKEKELFVSLHCTSADGKSAARCADALTTIPSLYRYLRPRDVRKTSPTFLRTKVQILGTSRRISKFISAYFKFQ